MNNINKILIAIDEGPAAEKIATRAYELAQQLHAEMALVSIVDTTALITEGNVTPADLANILKNDYKKSQQMLIEKVFEGNKIWSFVQEGRPYEGILSVAEEWDADLIVLGTHGRTGLSHLIMGSVAEKLIRHSTKPLLIIPAKAG